MPSSHPDFLRYSDLFPLSLSHSPSLSSPLQAVLPISPFDSGFTVLLLNLLLFALRKGFIFGRTACGTFLKRD